MGHPLYQFLGTKYQNVLEEYLGISAAASGTVCTWHSAENQGGTAISPTTAALIQDARTLLDSAENMLVTLDPSSPWFIAINNAAIQLELVIQQDNPGQSEVAFAMANLTQAMAGIY